MKVKPDFFIIGAAKSGTTSLYQYLGQHPGIYFSPIKEPNFFSDDIDVSKFSHVYRRNTFLDIDNYFSKEKLEDLQLTFIRKSEHYEKLFMAGADYQMRGESSTSYLYSNTAAQNIFNFNPQAKIIAVLRNPMERAFSHYQMAVRYGHTKLQFKEAVEKDMREKEKAWGVSELFIELGLYYNQLKRYFDIFPKEQIKILFSTNLKNNLQGTLNECFQFLGVEEYKIEDRSVYNVSTTPRNIGLNHFLTQSGLKKVLKPIVPKFVFQLFYRPIKHKISKEDFDFLVDIYREDINKTANLLNVDLTNWLEYK